MTNAKSSQDHSITTTEMCVVVVVAIQCIGRVKWTSVRGRHAVMTRTRWPVRRVTVRLTAVTLQPARRQQSLWWWWCRHSSSSSQQSLQPASSRPVVTNSAQTSEAIWWGIESRVLESPATLNTFIIFSPFTLKWPIIIVCQLKWLYQMSNAVCCGGGISVSKP